MQKLSFRLNEKEFLSKQATPPPFRHRSNITGSCPSIQVHCSKLYCQVYFRLIQ